MKRLFAYANYQFKTNQIYKMNNVFVFLSTFIAIIIQYYIWLYVENTRQVDTTNIIVYVTFAFSLSLLLPIFSSADFIATKIMRGEIVNILQRPQQLFFINLAIQLGNTWYKFCYRVLPIWIVYAIMFSLNGRLAVSFQNIGVGVLSFLCSWVLAFVIGHCIGLLATMLFSINGLKSLFSGLLLIMGGGLLPINLYPQLLQNIVLLTPFPSVNYYPVALLSHMNEFSVQHIISQQLFWIVMSLLVLSIMQRYIYDKLEIMGG